jgi:hypothetical protein
LQLPVGPITHKVNFDTASPYNLARQRLEQTVSKINPQKSHHPNCHRKGKKEEVMDLLIDLS